MPLLPAPAPFQADPPVAARQNLAGDRRRYAFGLGIAEILQAVAQAGSIKRAAAQLGKSYRHVWGRVKAAEKALGQPLVETQVGGAGDRRSTVTPLAQRYATAFLQLRGRMKELLQGEFARLFANEGVDLTLVGHTFLPVAEQKAPHCAPRTSTPAPLCQTGAADYHRRG